MWKQDQRRQAIRGGRQEDGLLRVISGLAMTGWRWARVPRLARALSARRAAICTTVDGLMLLYSEVC